MAGRLMRAYIGAHGNRAACWLPALALLTSALFAGEDPAAEWKKLVDKRLERRASIDLVESPLDDAMNFLRNATDLTLIVDPVLLKEGPPNVTLSMRGKNAGEVLAALLIQTGLTYELGEEALFFYRADTMSRRRAAQRGALSDEQKLNLERWIGELSAQDFRAREAATLEIVKLSGAAVPLLQAAARKTADAETFLRIHRLLTALAAKPFFVETPEVTEALDKLVQPLTFDFSFLPLREVAGHVSKLTQTEIRVAADNELQQIGVTLNVNRMKAGNVLRWAARLTNARISVKNKQLFFEQND